MNYSEAIKQRRVLATQSGILVQLMGSEVAVNVFDDRYEVYRNIAPHGRKDDIQPLTIVPRGDLVHLADFIAAYVLAGDVIHGIKVRMCRKAHKNIEEMWPGWDVNTWARKKYVKIVTNMIREWHRNLPKNKWSGFYKLHYSVFGFADPAIQREECIDWADTPIKLMLLRACHYDLEDAQAAYEYWQYSRIGKCEVPRAIGRDTPMMLMTYNAPRLPKSRIIWEMYARVAGSIAAPRYMLFLHILERSTPAQAIKAMRILNGYTHAQNMRIPTIHRATLLILDTPAEVFRRRNITIVGVAEACVEWHREQAKTKMLAEKVDIDYLEMPERIGPLRITPMKTSSDLAEEGQKMSNCVGNYTHMCIGGGSYILHAEYEDGHGATIEIRSQNGKYIVNQCFGVSNSYTERTSNIRRIITRYLATHVPEVHKAEKPVKINSYANLPVAAEGDWF